jgi:hypothetical protein
MARLVGRFRCADTVSDWRGRDQGQEPDEGESGRLVCRIVEDRNGNLHIMAAGRLRLRARRNKDGVLEIRHEGEETGDQADPDITGTYPVLGGDPPRAATGDALSRYLVTGRPELHMPSLAAYQKRLNDYYGG